MPNDTCHSPAAIDKLEKLAGHAFVVEMVDLFFDYAPTRLAAAREALAAGDLPGIEQAVHPLKASSAHVGAVKVNALAKQIEQLAKEKNGGTLPALLAELEAAYLEVKPLLQVARDASAVKAAAETQS